MTADEVAVYVASAEGTCLEGRLDQFVGQMTYGPSYNRGVLEFVRDAMYAAGTGDEDSALLWLALAMEL